MKVLLIPALALVLAAAAAADSTAAPGPGTAPAAPVITVKDYAPEEFPAWLLKLRRAEIVAVGSFPVTYLLTGLSYDYGYYVANGFPDGNVPWPLGPGTSKWTSSSQGDQLQQKNWTLVGVSLGLSVMIAAADWLLGEL